MSFLLPGAPQAIPYRAWPVNFGRADHSGLTFSLTVTNPRAGAAWVVTAVDAVVTGSSGIQCFCDVVVNGAANVFHDSQSIGEGEGVSFYWRGQQVLSHSDSLVAQLSSTSSADLSIAVAGYVIPLPPSTP